MNSGGYPLGAENDPRAPYNQLDNPEIKVKLGVGYGVYKEIEVSTSDYEVEEGDGEDGHDGRPNFDNTDFGSIIDENCPEPKGWDCIDKDFEIIE